MKLDIIRIGNSHGVRLPKAILESCGLKDSVTLSIEDGRLVLSASNAPRSNWGAGFEKMAKNSDDDMLLNTTSDWDDEEWQW